MLTPGEMQKIFNKINPVLQGIDERIKALEEKAKPAPKSTPAKKEVDKS